MAGQPFEPELEGEVDLPQDQPTCSSSPPVRERVAFSVAEEVVHITFPAGKADGIAVRELYEVSVAWFGAHHVHVLVDFTGTTFVPSGMMGMLLTVKKRLSAAGGKLHVIIPDPLVHASFQAMGMHRVLTIHQVIEDAAKHY